MIDVKQYLEKQQEMEESQNAEKRDLLTKLKLTRVKSENAITRKEKQIEAHKADIAEINAAICKIAGHEWTPWIEYEDMYVDRSWHYIRTCQCCGKSQSPRENGIGTPNTYITENQWREMQKHKAQAGKVPKTKQRLKRNLTAAS